LNQRNQQSFINYCSYQKLKAFQTQKEPILFPGKALYLLPYREILLFILSKPKTFAEAFYLIGRKRALSSGLLFHGPI